MAHKYIIIAGNKRRLSALMRCTCTYYWFLNLPDATTAIHTLLLHCTAQRNSEANKYNQFVSSRRRYIWLLEQTFSDYCIGTLCGCCTQWLKTLKCGIYADFASYFFCFVIWSTPLRLSKRQRNVHIPASHA